MGVRSGVATAPRVVPCPWADAGDDVVSVEKVWSAPTPVVGVGRRHGQEARRLAVGEPRPGRRRGPVRCAGDPGRPTRSDRHSRDRCGRSDSAGRCGVRADAVSQCRSGPESGLGTRRLGKHQESGLSALVGVAPFDGPGSDEKLDDAVAKLEAGFSSLAGSVLLVEVEPKPVPAVATVADYIALRAMPQRSFHFDKIEVHERLGSSVARGRAPRDVVRGVAVGGGWRIAGHGRLGLGRCRNDHRRRAGRASRGHASMHASPRATA